MPQQDRQVLLCPICGCDQCVLPAGVPDIGGAGEDTVLFCSVCGGEFTKGQMQSVQWSSASADLSALEQQVLRRLEEQMQNSFSTT